jgi:hypothetical protein
LVCSIASWKRSNLVERCVYDLPPVLGVVSKLDCVVIGGQAVNIWCEHYARENYVPTAQWDELKPFTSLDLDVLGSFVEAEEAGPPASKEPGVGEFVIKRVRLLVRWLG